MGIVTEVSNQILEEFRASVNSYRKAERQTIENFAIECEIPVESMRRFLHGKAAAKDVNLIKMKVVMGVQI